MLKPVIVATAVLAIAGSSLVYAQQRYDGPVLTAVRASSIDIVRAPKIWRRIPTPVSLRSRPVSNLRPTRRKTGRHSNKRCAKWLSFASRECKRVKRGSNAQNQTPTTPLERLSRRADNMSKASAALKRIADAGAPLYMSLTDAQKERFTKLARMLRPHHHQLARGCGGQPWRPRRRRQWLRSRWRKPAVNGGDTDGQVRIAAAGRRDDQGRAALISGGRPRIVPTTGAGIARAAG